MSTARTSSERRTLAVEIRARGRRLEGYAATFNNQADIGGRFVETIAPGAFAASLRAKGDILALVDHDLGRVLARTRSGTLRLAEDARGLAFDLDVPDTSAGRDVLALAERGDLGGMSFGFTAFDEHRDGDRRELRGVELHEISVVLAWPAYDGTVIQARSLETAAPFRRYAERALKLLELSR
ncbi:HK97 family phage prohead protease [Mesorhizobium retamae]|uniref:HK97 family phage prohead protease n=1 Tax=Mesorhizobium retamae TaxID=2912854 RepID=A0ABS9QML2_9HYPH|nr:HK97 family phage prohead protease [Mesorhizobium sp. IRAMC:0171]